MNFPVIFNTIILLGALQGFILCSLLFLSRRNRLRNKLLAWLILFISLASIKLYGTSNGWFNYPFMRWVDAVVPLIVVMPVGPLIYFYVRATLHPEFTVGRKEKRHFYTALIDIVPQLTAIIFIGGVLTHVFAPNAQPWGIFIDNYNVYSDIPRWLSVSVYVYMSSKLLSVHPSGEFKWLRQMLIAFMIFQVIWLLYLIPYVIPKYTGFMLDTFNWYPVYVPLAILVYWLGIKGYIVSQTESARAKKTVAMDPELVDKTIIARRSWCFALASVQRKKHAVVGVFPPPTIRIKAIILIKLKLSYRRNETGIISYPTSFPATQSSHPSLLIKQH